MSNMIRQIIALFDEYQSKENAKHALRAMKENARQGFWNDHLRALAQRIEVDAKEVRIIGSKRVLLRTLVATESAKTAGFGVPGFVPKWPLWRQRSTGLIEIKRPVSAMTLVTCDHC
jgi:hypothetical protein